VPGTPVTPPVTLPPVPTANSVTGQLLARLNPFPTGATK
jgi:hypothetical protein